MQDLIMTVIFIYSMGLITGGLVTLFISKVVKNG